MSESFDFYKELLFPVLQGVGPETITIGDTTSGYRYLHYVHNYASSPVFDDVNCVADIYGFFNLSGPIQVPIAGNERYFVVGCFQTPDDFHFVNQNVATYPSGYPEECPRTFTPSTAPTTAHTSFTTESTTMTSYLSDFTTVSIQRYPFIVISTLFLLYCRVTKKQTLDCLFHGMYKLILIFT